MYLCICVWKSLSLSLSVFVWLLTSRETEKELMGGWEEGKSIFLKWSFFNLLLFFFFFFIYFIYIHINKTPCKVVIHFKFCITFPPLIYNIWVFIANYLLIHPNYVILLSFRKDLCLYGPPVSLVVPCFDITISNFTVAYIFKLIRPTICVMQRGNLH